MVGKAICLAGEFARSVRRNGKRRLVFRRRRALTTERGVGRCEDDAANTTFARRLEHVQRSNDVHLAITPRVGEGSGDPGLRRQVNDSVVVRECPLHRTVV